jgi:hypothetical protein
MWKTMLFFNSVILKLRGHLYEVNEYTSRTWIEM